MSPTRAAAALLAAVALLAAPALARAQLATVVPTLETDDLPDARDSADDPAIWIHPTDPNLSAFIGTHKDYGLGVYDLAGRVLQSLPSGDMNNVDLRYGFPLGGKQVDLVIADERGANTLLVYAVDPATRQLADVAASPIEVNIPQVYGVCMYRSPRTGKFYVFATSEKGNVEQWELFDDGTGHVAGTSVRTFDVGGISEGCVADDEHAQFYVGEENEALWRYGAEPEDGSARVRVDGIDPDGHLVADIEGLAIYYASDGGGYLLASSQGSNSFVVYRRGGANEYLFTFEVDSGSDVDGVSRTDGIDVTNFPLGRAFPTGVFVAHDDSNSGGKENFKLVPWGAIAALGSPPLVVDPGYDPRGGTPGAGCDDGVPCTLDGRDASTGDCRHEPLDALCDNGEFCDGSETCDPERGCQPGRPVVCDDGIACTLDACDDATDACTRSPEDARCNDGRFCNGVERCEVDVGCLAGVPPCPGSSCDETSATCGCTGPEDCDDGSFCSGSERCEGGVCVAGTAPDCDDGVPCTDDRCDEAIAGCLNSPRDDACDDGDYCDGLETCDALLGCQPGEPVVCGDGVACTVDVCNEREDVCEFLPDDSRCSDGLFCNGEEICDLVADCRPAPPPCAGAICDESGQRCEGSSGLGVSLEQVETGGSSQASAVATAADLAARPGELYLAAISTKPWAPVVGVEGLGLEWSEVLAQCAGRSATGIALWMALGNPTGDDVVAASLAEPALNAAIAVSRYAGVMQAAPLGAAVSANTQGVAGSCEDGVDAADWALELVLEAGSVAYGAVATRNKLHEPGAGYTQQAAVQAGSGGNVAGVAVEDGAPPSPGPAVVDGRLSRASDWAAVAVEIRSAGCLSDADCDDGVVCNGPEHCSGGSCVAGAPPSCDDGIGCTLDFCNPLADACEHAPDDGACDDGLFCNGSEVCEPTTGCAVGADPCAGQLCSEAGDVCEPVAGPVALEQLETGGASRASEVATGGDLAAEPGQLYLAAVATKPWRPVVAVDGLGLAWREVRRQCAGRGATGVSLWMALGEPASADLVVASLEDPAVNAVIAVSRYSGVSPEQPLGAASGANTNGPDGACDAGLDAADWSLVIEAQAGSLAYGAVATRNRTPAPGPGYRLTADVAAGSGGDVAGLAVEEGDVEATGARLVEGQLSGASDWAAVGVAIRAAAAP